MANRCSQKSFFGARIAQIHRQDILGRYHGKNDQTVVQIPSFDSDIKESSTQTDGRISKIISVKNNSPARDVQIQKCVTAR